MAFKAFLLTNKSDLSIDNLLNFFDENIDVEFQACGYDYVGNGTRVINSIYYDGNSMYATSVYKNSTEDSAIGENSFQIKSEDSLVQRKIF